MTCSQVRLALSARLDGERPETDQARLDDHLAGCADCRGWLATAEQLTAMVRVPQQQPTPDLTEAVLARFAADKASAERVADAARARWFEAIRLCLGAIAAVQLLLALPGVLGLEGTHVHHEVAAFAVAFLFAAFRPALARAYAPVALVLAGCLALSAVLELAQGTTTLGHEAAHLMTVVPAAMLVALAYRAGGTPLQRRGRTRPEKVAVR
jgi:predicted anti-sigma-YlaC factor YlaD